MAQDRRADDFGSVLRAHRLLAGLTQEDLAHRSGVAVRTVSDLERGRVRRPQRHTVDRLARVLDMPDAESALVSAARAAGVDVAGAGDMLPAVPQVRYSLPADTVAFTGRGRELGQITTAVADAAKAGGVVTIGTIDGMPGVGKTALAVHAAHVLAVEFPDRQLFIDLHAHTPGREPVKPQDALAGLLAATGVDARFLPGDLEGRSGMWRDTMAGQRAVLVLDNAASTSQVAPLLPGSANCLVLVTSRRHLGDLPGAVTPVLLDVLAPEQAQEMFTRLAPRTSVNPSGVGEVAGLAGFLPLAICLLARVFARHPSWTLADLAGEIQARLLMLTAENDSIAAAFDVSYRCLDPGRQRFFRLLGLHPCATTDAHAAAALTGTNMGEAAGHLEALYGEGLLTETAYGRYGMHDLIRRYARDLAAADTPATSGQQAVGRLLDYYQCTAALADKCLARQVRPSPGPPVPAEFEVPVLLNAGRALAWMRANRASLLTCLDLANQTGQHARVVALTAGLAAILRRDGPWADAITRHVAAVDAAHHLRDQLGEANALTELGTARRLTSHYTGAAQVLEQALDIYRDLGNRLGEADALTELGIVRRMTGEYPGATQVLERALDIYRDLGNRLGEADALTNLGAVWWLTGEYPGAAHVLERALDIYRDLGNRLGEASALTYLGVVRRMTGEYPGAAQVLEQALVIYRDRDLGNPHGEAYALTELGVVRRMTGEYPGAARALEQALAIYRNLGNRHAEADARTHLGVVRRMTGEYPGAAQALEQALAIYRDLSNRPGEVEALNEQASLYRVGGDLAGAQKCHRHALDLARTIGSAWDEACALAGLGRCAMAIGNAAQAEILLRQAHQIFQRIGAAETRDVLAELDALSRPL